MKIKRFNNRKQINIRIIIYVIAFICSLVLLYMTIRMIIGGGKATFYNNLYYEMWLEFIILLGFVISIPILYYIEFRDNYYECESCRIIKDGIKKNKHKKYINNKEFQELLLLQHHQHQVKKE